MDFRVNEDQQALVEGVRSFCEGQVGPERLPSLEGAGYDEALWKELAELGVFALREPEKDGGVGLGSAEAVLVFAELGRRLVPGPLVWSHLAAPLVRGAGAGEVVVGGLDLLGPSPGPILVEHLESLDALLVLRPEGVFEVARGELSGSPVEVPLDPLTPLHHLESLPPGRQLGDPADAARLRTEGAVLVAAQLLGIAESTQELAVDYAKKREQFGRPIGSFQALKHILADMFVRQEVARAAVYAAGATLDDPGVGDVPRAASGAKLEAGEAALLNSRACIQVYGGMGYTWEMPPHYYLKRTWVLRSVFGGADEHAEQIAQRVGAGL